jgi:hypothetical protein
MRNSLAVAPVQRFVELSATRRIEHFVRSLNNSIILPHELFRYSLLNSPLLLSRKEAVQFQIIRGVTMTELRKRMIECLQLRGFPLHHALLSCPFKRQIAPNPGLVRHRIGWRLIASSGACINSPRHTNSYFVRCHYTTKKSM